MKKITVVVVTIILLSTSKLYSQDKYGKLSFNKAVNIAGKQRMLSQKISKAYLYILENPSDVKAQTDLSSSKIIFEKHNEILQENAVSDSTKDKVDEVISIWNQLKSVFGKKPNYASAEKIVKNNSVLLSKANEVVESIILDAEASHQSLDDASLDENIELKEIINTAGKQRMLSQRLALYYFANAQQLQTEKTKTVLEETYNKINNNISELLISDFNSIEIEEALTKTMTLWQEIKNDKKGLLNQKLDKQDIYNKSNQLTKAFNKVTLLYEKVK